MLEGNTPKIHNTVLVAENSKLRMHLSFTPVQYRDFAANMQTSNHQAYLAQRSDPKVIVSRDNHAYGAEITLTHAPMSHPSVQAYLRDAQYTSIWEAKEMLERSFQLRARLRENKETARIPLKFLLLLNKQTKRTFLFLAKNMT